MHTFATWVYAIVGAALIAGFIPSVWHYLKAWDMRFDPEEAKQKGRQINWAKARKQQVVTLRLGLPMGLIVLALLAYHYWWNFSWETYTYISIGWFLSAPLRRLWQFAVSIRFERAMVRYGFREAAAYNHSAWYALKQYYRNGTRRKNSSASSGPKGFGGRLQWMNKISWLWLWVRHIRVALPILAEAFVSLFWPITTMFMVFHHADAAADGLNTTPWWQFRS